MEIEAELNALYQRVLERERRRWRTRRDEARRLKVEEGKNNAEIGRALGISRKAVKKLLDAFPEEQELGVQFRHRETLKLPEIPQGKGF